MGTLTDLYRPSLALLTDLYELTMACGFWRAGVADHHAAFHVVFRHNPFDGGYAVAAGLEYVIELIERFRFEPADLAYLASLTGSDDRPLFDEAFLDYLGDLRLRCDVDAIVEGTVVFAHEPLVRVAGPIIDCQILETALLNLMNFQTLIATKASRVCHAARGEPVIEFGARRAQGVDGAIAASRAAYVGGCAATSNVLAGRLFGIPVRGTHAHSWVMLFADELAAFEAWGKAMPNNSILLVDTYDSLEGVRHAIRVGRQLRARGYKLAGIRLDSGDLAYLSIEARRLLDEAGFGETRILASNELDEHVITSLKQQGATISLWGVGTKLATAFDQPALGGVYKLAAVRRPGGAWEHKIKLSEQAAKVSTPGLLQVRRYARDGEYMADAIYDELTGIGDGCTIVDPLDITRRRPIPAGTNYEDLLVPIFRDGKRVYDPPPIAAVRERTLHELGRFHAGIKRFVYPHQYPVGLEERLHDLKTNLILKLREQYVVRRVSQP